MTTKKLQWNGYIKEMAYSVFDKDFREPVSTNLLHNRINIDWKPQKTISAAVEFRNRLYWGDAVNTTPAFTSLLRNENEWLNLSALWVNTSRVVFQTNIDRAWAEFRQPKWMVRLGRQRINWGLTTVWNPNDIFNTYNFLDFDYEERPGADAVYARYNFSDSSAIDMAVNPNGDSKRSIGAMRYCVNRRGYHLQMLAGLYRNKLTAGFGWAGTLGSLSYKGEGQIFIGEEDSVNRFNYSLELSYSFKKGWYVSGSVLHNTTGLSEPVTNTAKINFRLSPINPMPGRWSFITIASKQFKPGLSSSLNLVYSPEIQLFIIYPSFNYQLLHRLDADLVLQSFFLELQKKFQATSHTAFVRLKYRF